MHYKLKRFPIRGFCDQLASWICNNLFADKEKISGEGIMAATPVDQVNLLIVRALYAKWQEEVSRLKSPYFDYEAPEARKALHDFMDILSRHISVGREDYEPLLYQSLEDLFLITYTPLIFYEKALLEGVTGEVSVTNLEGQLRYFKTNEKPLRSLIKDLKKKAGAISLNGLEILLTEAYEGKEIICEEPAIFLSRIAGPEPFDVSELFEMPVTEEKIVEEKTTMPDNSRASTALHEKYHENKVTLAEQLQKETVKDIESGISLNEKFMFINHLFDGDKEQFKLALEELENAADLQEARKKVDRKYAGDWDMESEAVTAFLEALERRFA